MNSKKYKKIKLFCSMLFCVLALSLCNGITVQAASLNLSEICQEFESAIQKNNKQVSFSTSSNYTIEQLLNQLSKAAENHNKLFTGEYTCQKQTINEQTNYTFYFTENSFMKVKFLKNQAQACKAALKALKKKDYTAKFYSHTPYDSVFMLMLQQHPEYNYNTMVWKSSNGAYGY